MTGGWVVRPATPADAAGCARVTVDTWRATYRGIVADEYLDSLSYQRQTERWAERLVGGQVCTHVAVTTGGTVVGYVGGGPARDGGSAADGEVYAIYVLPGHQGTGIGRSLMAAAAASLVAAGRRSLLVWVLADNQAARRFYAALGAHQSARQSISIGGREYDEVAYTWPDATRLTGP